MIRSLATFAAILVLALAGCGGDDESSSSGGGAPTSTPASESGGGGGGGGGGGEKIALAAPADGSLKFDKSELEAKAGTVTIDFDNPSSTPHAVEIEGNGVEEASDTVTDAKTSVTADLKPGEYKFYCPVGNHAAAGMEGTLTVK
jgi:plastocyanin